MAIGPRRIDFGENYAELDAMHLAARTAEICRATDESQRQVGVSRGSRVKQLLEKYVPNFNAEDVFIRNLSRVGHDVSLLLDTDEERCWYQVQG